VPAPTSITRIARPLGAPRNVASIASRGYVGLYRAYASAHPVNREVGFNDLPSMPAFLHINPEENGKSRNAQKPRKNTVIPLPFRARRDRFRPEPDIPPGGWEETHA